MKARKNEKTRTKRERKLKWVKKKSKEWREAGVGRRSSARRGNFSQTFCISWAATKVAWIMPPRPAKRQCGPREWMHRWIISKQRLRGIVTPPSRFLPLKTHEHRLPFVYEGVELLQSPRIAHPSLFTCFTAIRVWDATCVCLVTQIFLSWIKGKWQTHTREVRKKGTSGRNLSEEEEKLGEQSGGIFFSFTLLVGHEHLITPTVGL